MSKNLHKEIYDKITSSKGYFTVPPDDNIWKDAITADGAFQLIANEILGKDWYSTNPIGQKQIYVEQCYDILYKLEKIKNIKRISNWLIGINIILLFIILILILV